MVPGDACGLRNLAILAERGRIAKLSVGIEILSAAAAFVFISSQHELVDRMDQARLARAAEFWWAHQDLNLEPTDYESAALTN
jgi:hypothetical protein